MPIDAAIPLSVQPPKVDILGALAKAQQVQAGQQQLEMGDIQTAQAGLALKDQQIMRSAYGQAGGDLDKMVPLVAGKVSPKALLDLQNANIERKYKLSQIDDNALKVHQGHAAEIADKSLGILNAPAEQRPALYHQAVSDLAKAGIMTPQEVQALPRDAAGNFAYPGDESIKLHAHSKDVFEQENKRREDIRAGNADTRAAELQPLKVQEAQGNIRTNAAALPGVEAGSVVKQQEATGTKPIQPAQQAQIAATQAGQAETQRHNLSAESTARLNSGIAAGRLALERTVNGMKYGAGTSEYWVQQLQENPDSIKEMPAELRSVVGKGFTQKTGLPLPTPADGNTKTQETAARNALDGAKFIHDALQNPEIRKNIGPILGRLGNAEQAIGSAARLSPEASALAQELRTRMRYFVFQEGKAVLGGRLPAQLIKELEASSPNPKMDWSMLEGALRGATGNANSVLDNVDRQRFGGKMRPRAMRGAEPATSTQPAAQYLRTAEGPNGHQIGQKPDGGWYDVQTGAKVQ